MPFTCSACRKNPKTALKRRCEDWGFDLQPPYKKPIKIDDASLSYGFCPGKATWYPEIAELFEQCRVALDAGILPRDGNYLDQDELFVEVFPFFVRRWKERNYDKIWTDVRDFAVPILEAFSKRGV